MASCSISNKIRRDISESYDNLSRSLKYDPVSGDLTWLKYWHNNKKAGTATKGYKYQKPFIKVIIDGLEFKGHRIAWILYHGVSISEGLVIDHINGDATDNRIVNLRTATPK